MSICKTSEFPRVYIDPNLSIKINSVRAYYEKLQTSIDKQKKISSKRPVRVQIKKTHRIPFHFRSISNNLRYIPTANTISLPNPRKIHHSMSFFDKSRKLQIKKDNEL